MTAHKKTTLELTINPEYVADWGSWQGLRELMQNAVDAHDLGHPMTVTHRVNPQGVGVLRIVNEGITMARDTLLLGTTTKRGDDSQRGQFGEGFKLAWLALLRQGARIVVKSGDEIWVPQLGHSKKFDGQLIRVRCKPATYKNQVAMRIEGISKEAWDQVKRRLLFLTPAKDRIDVGDDGILTGPEHVGLLYARGIYVGKLPGKYRWGYDLCNIKLDRDRRLADPWDLRWAIQKVLERAVVQDKLRVDDVYQILEDGTWKESESINQYSGLSDVMAEAFKRQHGEDAVPVANMSASAEAAQHGIKGVVVSNNLCEALCNAMPTLDKAKEARVLDTKRRYSAHDLDPAELDNLLWAQGLGEGWLQGVDLLVVDFIGDTTLGVCGDGEIRIARKQLGDRAGLIATLVHELAHLGGSQDGTAEHRAGIENIFGTIVASMAEGKGA